MAKCKHEHPRGLTWDGEGYGWMTGGDDARVCRWCGEWLSLGPANDEGPRVRVEIRAAEMFAEIWSGDWTIDGCEAEDLEDANSDLALDALELALAQPRPRSPIEIMVDRACGIVDGGAR